MAASRSKGLRLTQGDERYQYSGGDGLLARIVNGFDDSDSAVVIPYTPEFELQPQLAAAAELIPDIQGAVLVLDGVRFGNHIWSRRHNIINVGQLKEGATLDEAFTGAVFYNFAPRKEAGEDRGMITRCERSVGATNLGQLVCRGAYVVLGRSATELQSQVESVFTSLYGPMQERMD